MPFSTHAKSCRKVIAPLPRSVRSRRPSLLPFGAFLFLVSSVLGMQFGLTLPILCAVSPSAAFFPIITSASHRRRLLVSRVLYDAFAPVTSPPVSPHVAFHSCLSFRQPVSLFILILSSIRDVVLLPKYTAPFHTSLGSPEDTDPSSQGARSSHGGG